MSVSSMRIEKLEYSSHDLDYCKTPHLSEFL